MLHGTISEEALKFYLRADASYLKEFANIYALLIPKMSRLEEVQFLVEQIQFIVDGEVEAHEILATYVQQNYSEIVQEKFGHQVEIIISNICISMPIQKKMLHIQLQQWHLSICVSSDC